MSLTDIMSAAGLSRWAEAALLLFIVAFVAIVWRIFLPSRKRSYEDAARLPLDDDTTPIQRP
jgi:cbb3-type cytochrome oxidase subunit 3